MYVDATIRLLCVVFTFIDNSQTSIYTLVISRNIIFTLSNTAVNVTSRLSDLFLQTRRTDVGFMLSGCVQMVKTTGGPALGASVSSPALTTSAIYLLQDSLNEQERQLWTSLGPNWTLPRSVPTNIASGIFLNKCEIFFIKNINPVSLILCFFLLVLV